MKYCVIGAKGQVGKEVVKLLTNANEEFVGVDYDELDITKKDDVISFVKKHSPKYLVNLAAYTAVDKAEDDVETCMAVNKDGPINIALGAKEVGSHFIHISTDYVFAGDLGRPLKEDDVYSPLNVYGQAKVQSEIGVREVLGDNYTILRVSSVHGQFGNNFVKTMIKLFHERDEVKVVSDQIMSPTWAGFMAQNILKVFDKHLLGTYHLSNKGQVSWYDFACAVKEYIAKAGDETKAKLSPCLSSEYKTRATRPAFSPFCLDKIEKALGEEMQSWQDGLKCHLRDLGYNI